jgi:hypothetical protein
MLLRQEKARTILKLCANQSFPEEMMAISGAPPLFN